MGYSDFQEPHLKDYINILRRRWFFLLIPLLVIPLWQGIPILNSHPTYQSTATVQLEPEKGFSYSFAQSFSPEFLFLNERWTNNQINIIKGKVVAEKVVKKLGLRIQMIPEERVYQSLLKIWISDFPAVIQKWNSLTKGTLLSEPFTQVVVRPLQVSDEVKEGHYRGIFQDAKHFTIYDREGKWVGNGETGQPFEGQNFSCQVEGEGRRGKCFDFNIVSELAAALAIQTNLLISPIKETSLIEVGIRWNEPVMARDIANAVVDAYQEAMVSKKAGDISQVLSFIESQLKVAEEDLHKAEENLSKFKGKEKVVNFDAQIKETLEQATQYGKELNALAIQRKQAEIVLTALNSSREFNEREALFSLGAGLNDSLLVDFGKKLSDLRIQKAALLTLYKEEHPKIKQLEREIESIKKNIVRGVLGLISSIKIKEKALQTNLEKLEEKIQYIPATEQELYSLQRIVKVSAGINEFLLQKRAELSVNKAGIVSNVYVVDMAITPRGFVRTELMRTILLALLFGGALGVGLAFLVEYFDSSVKTPEQIQKMIDLPYLGTIYHFYPQDKTYKEELQMLEAPYSHIAEAFRTIKTNLIFAASVGDPKRFILITSSAPSEGKTFVTANLGVALAQSGKRVLLVETDLRNPFLHEIFGIEKSPGLTNAMLNGEIEYPDLPIRPTQVENLEFMPSGDNPPNPSELLCSEKMEMVFSALREQYDFILFDSPPVFLTSDPIILAQRVDGVIIVARSGETNKDIFRESVERLLRVEAKILGVLFNDMHKEGKKYYYKKYGKYYGKYYGKSVEKDRIN
jgi:capsular exopolysaccharide synthesis family protein